MLIDYNYQPFFILGNPRSGTTLIRLMLSCHEDLVVPPECGFAVWFYSKYSDLFNSSIDDRNYEIKINEFVNDLMQANKFENWELDRATILKSLRTNKPANYPNIVSLIYSLYSIKLKGKCTKWGDKNNFYINHIDTILNIYPKAKLIHIVRDGRAVMNSYKNIGKKTIASKYAPKLPQNVDDIALQWKANIHTIAKAFSCLDKSQHLTVRYEDLVLQPVDTLSQICRFLETSFDKIMLNYHEMGTKIGQEGNDFIQWKEKNSKPLLPEEVTRFRTELTTDDITRFEELAKDELIKHSYL